MLEELKFVQGSVAKKDFVPELTHFCIRQGYIRGFNGRVSLCSPIALDIDATPKAVPFIKAIQACSTTTSIHMTKSGRLAIKSGAFKAFIPCTETPFPDVYPGGVIQDITEPILPTLKKLAPFMGEDASRPWACGIMLKGEHAYATNNVLLIRHDLPCQFTEEPVNIPRETVKELLRIGLEPEAIQVDTHSATFWYSSDKWLRTNLLSIEWPASVDNYFDKNGTLEPTTSLFFESLEAIKPFVNEMDQVFITADSVATDTAEGEGASMDYPHANVEETLCYNLTQLLKLQGVAEQIAFAALPCPAYFEGDDLVGIMLGMRY